MRHIPLPLGTLASVCALLVVAACGGASGTLDTGRPVAEAGAASPVSAVEGPPLAPAPEPKPDPTPPAGDPAPAPAPSPAPSPAPIPAPAPAPTPPPPPALPATLPDDGTTAWAPAADDGSWVNVASFGAKGDGVADDTAAFRAAAATGKQLFVPRPAAFYRLSGPVALRNTIAGDGSMPRLQMTGANGDAEHQLLRVVDQSFAAMAYVQGLTLDGGWDGTWTPGGEYAHGVVVAGTTNLTVRHAVIRNVGGDGVMIGGDPGRGGSSAQSRNVHVLHDTIERTYRCGVAVIHATGFEVRFNAIRKYNGYVTAVDAEPNPDGYTSVNAGTIADNVFDCQHTAAVMLYHFDYGYPASGVAGDGIVVTRNTGAFQGSYGFALVGRWTNVTNSANGWN
jgi:hypothetical protein